MGTLSQKSNINSEDHDILKGKISNEIGVCINLNKIKKENNITRQWSLPTFYIIKTKDLLKPSETVNLSLELISNIISNLNTKVMNLNFYLTAFFPRFIDSCDNTFDSEDIFKRSSEIRSWMEFDFNQYKSKYLFRVGELLPSPPVNIPFLDVSSIHGKESNNLNTLSGNGSYSEDEFISSSKPRIRKTEENKKLSNNLPNYLKASSKLINKKFKSSISINPGNKPNFQASTKSSNQDVLNNRRKARFESDKNNKINTTGNDTVRSSNNIITKNSNSLIQQKNKEESHNIQKKTDGKKLNFLTNYPENKFLYRRRITELIEEDIIGNEEKFSKKETLNTNSTKFIRLSNSANKPIISIPEINNKNKNKTHNKAENQNKLKNPSILGILKNTFNMKNIVKTEENLKEEKFNTDEKKTDKAKNSIRVAIKKEKTIKNALSDFQSIKNIKINLKQLENEDKTTEHSNSPQALLSLEKMKMDKLLALQNLQRNKWIEIKSIESIKSKMINKSPKVNDSIKTSNEKNSILIINKFNRISKFNNSTKEALESSDEERLPILDLKSNLLFKDLIANSIPSATNALKFPKYEIDVTPLSSHDLPVDQVLKVLKKKNKFLFEETKEEKDLNAKIQKLTLESIESN